MGKPGFTLGQGDDSGLRAKALTRAWLGTAALAFMLSTSSGPAAESPAGAATEKSSPGLVDPNSTLTSSAYDTGFTDALPIIGHAWQDTLILAPGVSDLDGDGNPVVHGARENSVFFALDGADSTDPAGSGWGLNLDPLSIDRVTLITAGAPAEYGRAMGGFSDIITRSGGNDFEGRLWVLWRGSFLDGDGADNEDFLPFEEETLPWNDLRAAGSAGGAIVKDKLWYFATLETIDSEQPTEALGPDSLIESHGYFGLGKLTWQADAVNRIDLQVSTDPLEISGLGIAAFTSPDSGFDQDQGGVLTVARWTSLVSPDLMFDAALTHFDTDITITPTSDFDPQELDVFQSSFFSPNALSARYPCFSPNCAFDDDISRIDEFGQVTGPYPFLIDRESTRDSLHAALTIDLDDHLGDHRFRMGFEAGQEELHEEQAANLVLIDLTTPFIGTGGPFNPLAVSGVQIIQSPQPSRLDGTVNNFFLGAWLSDSWKVLPGLTINAGIRYDSDDLDAPGYRNFDPREERIESIGLWEGVCAEARRQGVVQVGSNCSVFQNYDANPPEVSSGVIQSHLDANMDGVNDVPEEVAALDVNGNGTLEFFGSEGLALYKHFTTYATRRAERFTIEESTVSPRIGISWDPWSDGKTRAFAHWGRYHDRLRLETALFESGPDYLSFAFTPHPTSHLIHPGSDSSGSGLPSISQVDHELETPYTDEWSLGVERELGAAWSAGLTFVSRSAENLLFDRDINHHTCAQSGDAIDFDPNAICGSPQGLEVDKFGEFIFVGFPPIPFQIPNGLEDLYVASNAFNQVHRVANTSDADYTSWEVKLVRALHRSWQMQASYVHSRARGTIAIVNGDASLSGAETGSLDFDQRDMLKMQAAAHLPHGIVLGGMMTWASGTPYSIFETMAELDQAANAQTRTVLPTGALNDQRNDAMFRLDGRIEKSFTMGRATAGAFLLVENLLNDDDLVIESATTDASTLIGTRDFGRRFEIGALFSF